MDVCSPLPSPLQPANCPILYNQPTALSPMALQHAVPFASHHQLSYLASSPVPLHSAKAALTPRTCELAADRRRA